MEWLLFGISASGVGLLCLQLKSLSRWVGLVLLLLLGGSVAAAKFWQDRTTAVATKAQQFQRTLPREGRPGGYVSSDTCQSCHPREHASWHMSYHRTMTQYATPDSVRGPFNHPPLEQLDSPISLSQRGDEFWVEMDDPDWVARRRANPGRYPAFQQPPRVERRIGLLTGSHHMQVYWVPSEKGNLQHLFPYAYLFEKERWVPFNDTFLRDPSFPSYTQLWNLNCMNCHSTAGQPRPDLRTKKIDTRTAEIGISCEACHGPAEEHIEFFRNPLNRYRAPQGEATQSTIVNPEKLDAQRSSMVCGQCHGISWISDSAEAQQHGFRFRPGELLNQNRKLVRAAHLDQQPYLQEPLRRNPRFLSDRYWPDGMVRVSGREYSGMMESPCHVNGGNLSCLSCHDLHHDQPRSQSALDWRDDQLGERGHSNSACLQCHESIGSDLEAHTHHPVGSSGSECYNCHMPHTTYGLLKAIRSHHIDNPSVETSLKTGRPNACNLCHLDKTLDWTSRRLAEWYGHERPSLDQEQKEVAAGLLWLLKGEAGQRALLAWHFGWDAAKEASGSEWMGYALAQGLVDPYSAVRFITERSLRGLKGMEDLEYDFIGPEDDRNAAMDQARSIWRGQERQERPEQAGHRLLTDQGEADTARLEALVRTRDNRSMDLQE